MCGVTNIDRLRNEVVRQRSDLETHLVARVDRNVLRLFEHVERMNNWTLLKTVLNAKSEGKGARDGPRLG